MERYWWVDDNGHEHELTVRGPRLLVRKCLRNEEDFLVGEAKGELTEEARLMIEGMVRSERMVPQQKGIRATNWCSVLAVGPGVGRSRTPREMSRYKRGKQYSIPWGVVLPVQSDDWVVLPETSGLANMWRGVTGAPHDIMVDMTEIIAYMREGDELPRPAGSRLLIEPDNDPQKVGEIHIPDNAVERPTIGTVRMVGSGNRDKTGAILPSVIDSGAKVLFPKTASLDVKINKKAYFIVQEKDLLAVLR